MSNSQNAQKSIRERVLIVEDELILAMDLEAILEENSFDVIDAVRNVETALAALSNERPDIVTLDMNLDGESSAPIAAKLIDDGIPFVLLSGYDPQTTHDTVFDGAPLVRKPFATRDLMEAIRSVRSQ